MPDHQKSEPRIHQNPREPTRNHQKPPEATRIHQNPAEPIRNHQKPPEPTRTHQTPPDLIRIRHQNPPELTRPRAREVGILRGGITPPKTILLASWAYNPLHFLHTCSQLFCFWGCVTPPPKKYHSRPPWLPPQNTSRYFRSPAFTTTTIQNPPELIKTPQNSPQGSRTDQKNTNSLPVAILAQVQTKSDGIFLALCHAQLEKQIKHKKDRALTELTPVECKS